MDWLLTALFALLALAAYLLYRRERSEADSFRAESRRRIAELAALGYNKDRVGPRVIAMGQASRDVLLVCKTDYSVIYLNPAAELMFGSLRPDAGSLIAVTRHNEICDLAADALAGRDDLDRQIFVNGKAYRARAATYEDGVALALTDVSELQRLGRARRDFIANISHELRTPLTAIRLLTDTLKSPAGQKPGVAPTLIDKITVETESLSQLAQELLDLATIESGQAAIKLIAAPVKPVVDATVHRLAELAARKQQTITIDAPDDLSALMDAEQIGRVTLNLLHNAIKFAPAGGRIELKAQSADDGKDIVVQISDNGPGVDPDDLSRIFERFYRADSSRASGGTGLGLAIAKHIVEAHGGRIWAESARGEGAKFRFTLPAT
ncbi:MAG: ATP-binding protein [Chloroflexota bacterium]